MTPGIHYGMPLAQYLAIPALSNGIIRTMIERCPAAAWFESAWNPNRLPDHSDASDAGSIAHEILLEGSRDCLQIIDPKDHPNATKPFAIPDGWTNKSIREARDAARACGKIPVLPCDVVEIDAMVDAGKRYIDSLRDLEPAVWATFQERGGDSEVVFLWMEGDTLCKARADRISKGHDIIIDYKSTATCVEPSAWARNMLDYVGAAWYRRGVRALTDVEPEYLFLAGERSPPYLHALIGVAPADLALGDEKVGVGLRAWQECERAKHWPGYPARACYPDLPAYVRFQWDERNGVGADGLPATNAEIWKARAA